jgi:hypothetical protein
LKASQVLEELNGRIGELLRDLDEAVEQNVSVRTDP